uniref:Uncharacterized protein n=1 Tax=Anopheles atroparvus TaxID=41427 RepID=A0AAG5DIL3_ANOAO
MHSSDRDPPLLELSYLENVLLSPIIGIRLGQLPRLTSVAIESVIHSYTESILSQLQNMYGIGGKRCRKLTLISVSLEWKSIDLLRSLSIDVLFFEDCCMDNALFEVLAQPQTRRSILKIMMHFCTLFCNGQTPCRVQTVEQLRGKFPWIQIEGLRYFHRCNIPNQNV